MFISFEVKISAVIGGFFGDEGKGSMTSFLSDSETLVVRFNGGQQAGHTVEVNGERFVHSSLGSGTLKGAATYISEFCTFYPKSFFNEFVSAEKIFGARPNVFIHPKAMVTTPFDIDYNRTQENKNQHGSVGMGFGQTINRNENSPIKLFVCDLYNDLLLEWKLDQIQNYYGLLASSDEVKGDRDSFLEYTRLARQLFKTTNFSDLVSFYQNIVFEGAQGTLLDMDHGFFPHVTRSNTTLENVVKILKSVSFDGSESSFDFHFMMRSYLTRHGNGPLPFETTDFAFEDQTNKNHPYQGNFRFAYHSAALFQHALRLNADFFPDLKLLFSDKFSASINITCLDQTDGKIYFEGKQLSVGDFFSQDGVSKVLELFDFLSLLSNRLGQFKNRNYFRTQIKSPSIR